MPMPSFPAAPTVLIPPVINTQPANQTVNVGQAASFSVAATGSGTLAFQWWRNGLAIPGATAAAYSTPPLAGSDSGSQFAVVVSNSAGQVTSAAATVTISNSLALSRQSASQGTILEFGPLTLGSTRAQMLVLSNVDTVPLQISESKIIGSFGVSMNAPLVLMPAQSASVLVTFTPVVLGEAYGEAIVRGDAFFRVGLHGTGTTSHYAMLMWDAGDRNVTYNAYRSTQTGGPYEKLNTFPIFNSTIFVDPNPQAGATYYYTVSGLNDYLVESSFSGEVQVTVPASASDLSTITIQPASQSVAAGGTVTFTVTAQGKGLAYQWLRNGVLVPGATGSSYTIPGVSPDDDGASFLVMVNSGAGIATSSSATLTVIGVPGSPAGNGQSQ